MTLLRYLFEGAADGDPASTSNTSASLIFPGNGTISFAATRGRHNLGLDFASASGAQTEARFDASAANASMAMRGWFWGPAATPAETIALCNIRSSSGVMARFQWTAANSLIIVPTSGSNLTLATNLTPNIQYDLSVLITGGTTGSISAILRSTSGTTVGNVSSNSFNSGNSSPAGAGIGLIGNYSQSYGSGWDELSFDDGSTSEIPLYVPPSTPVGNLDLVWTGSQWR